MKQRKPLTYAILSLVAGLVALGFAIANKDSVAFWTFLAISLLFDLNSARLTRAGAAK